MPHPTTKSDENANHQKAVGERLTESVNFPKDFGKSDLGSKMGDLKGSSVKNMMLLPRD